MPIGSALHVRTPSRASPDPRPRRPPRAPLMEDRMPLPTFDCCELRAGFRSAVAFACSAWLTMACSGATVPIGNNDAPEGDGQGINTDPTLFSAPSECTRTPTGAQTASSDMEARAQLMGRWLACSELASFGSTGQVGIELAVQFN